MLPQNFVKGYQDLSCLTAGTQPNALGNRSLCGLRDAAAALPFAGSTSSKAEHIPQVQADTHTYADSWSHKLLPSTPPTYRTSIRQAQPVTSLSICLAETGRL